MENALVDCTCTCTSAICFKNSINNDEIGKYQKLKMCYIQGGATCVQPSGYNLYVFGHVPVYTAILQST